MKPIRIACVSILISLVVLLTGSSRSGPYAQIVTDSILVLPVLPVTVAPGQPTVSADSIEGIINALCDVRLNIVGCSFNPATIAILCDSQADGMPDILIPLTDIERVNRFLVRARIPALAPSLAGTAFPLACCGGEAALVLKTSFGGFEQTAGCSIDLGLRAPVVVSASPSGADCSVAQSILIPGTCFINPDGSPNVTSVFMVNRDDPNTIIQASKFSILSKNLIEALFQPGASNNGNQFLVFADGPNGRSRNLTALPSGADPECPLGNEQGNLVTFHCLGDGSTPRQPETPEGQAIINSCKVKRNAAGKFVIDIRGEGFRAGSTVELDGFPVPRAKFKKPVGDRFSKIVLKGPVCGFLPGAIVVVDPDGTPSRPLDCAKVCR